LSPTVTPTPTATPTPTPSGTPSTSQPLLNIKLPHLNLKIATHGRASHGSGATAPTATAGTGAATAAGTAGTGAAGTAGTAGTAATGTQPTTASAKRTGGHRTPEHTSSSGSNQSSPLAPAVKVIDHIVKVIPTAVWIALGAAFALMLAFAGLAFRSGRRARRREKEFAAISAAALTDALTGILNRRGFTEAAERELARASRYDRPFVLAYVDVRGLKSVNDTEGHLMGDELIKTVAGLMKESGRADDIVGRIGGDEFALLLAEQTAESADPVIRRIRARVAEARAEMEISVPWELTIGVASFPHDGKTLEELLDVSDRRLYEQRGIALR
jgi:diguanylate cyclase (GGDEF)-like protein